jgi:hypothetical protein
MKTDLKEEGVRMRKGFIWLRIWSSGGFLLTRNEHMGSIKEEEFLYSPTDYIRLRMTVPHGVGPLP